MFLGVCKKVNWNCIKVVSISIVSKKMFGIYHNDFVVLILPGGRLIHQYPAKKEKDLFFQFYLKYFEIYLRLSYNYSIFWIKTPFKILKNSQKWKILWNISKWIRNGWNFFFLFFFIFFLYHIFFFFFPLKNHSDGKSSEFIAHFKM